MEEVNVMSQQQTPKYVITTHEAFGCEIWVRNSCGEQILKLEYETCMIYSL